MSNNDEFGELRRQLAIEEQAAANEAAKVADLIEAMKELIRYQDAHVANLQAALAVLTKLVHASSAHTAAIHARIKGAFGQSGAAKISHRAFLKSYAAIEPPRVEGPLFEFAAGPPRPEIAALRAKIEGNLA